MVDIETLIDFGKYEVKPKKRISLKDYDTTYSGKKVSKDEAEAFLELGRNQLAEMQDRLYADNRYSVLIVFQAMDAAGKDSSIKHVMSGFNPQGVKVYSFKAPSKNELDHNYFWRHNKSLPARGEISIFNRSHYENVLITRVHPEYILGEKIPGVDRIEDIDQSFWDSRLDQINGFEKTLVENGMVILKFFLHVSKKEQKKRFLERIDKPEKNWKFSYNDLKERAFWDDYQHAYEEALSATSQSYAPWHVIPADDKWFSRLLIASVIYKKFDALNLQYPSLTDKQKEELALAREELKAEV